MNQLPPIDSIPFLANATLAGLGPENKTVAEINREELAQAVVEIGKSQCEQSFCRVYDYFAGRVKMFLIGKGMNDEIAEELMQEIMITVWRKAGLFDPQKAAASTWIFTIARNRRIDYVRRNYRVEVELDDALLEREPDNAEVAISLDAELHLRQNSERLYQALDELPIEQKQVMHLSYFRGQSHAAIAESLDMPLGTVKSRIRLALDKLKNIMQAEISSVQGISDGN